MNTATTSPALSHIAMIGNSVPRRCGIATFTTHCFEALGQRFPDMSVDHYAIDDGREQLEYPAHVRLISQHDRLSYSMAAQQIEESGAQAIWLQHEFGIFGGSAGDFILHLLARTRLPVITSLHTILERPNPDERRVMEEILARSSELIVMAERGRQILLDVYDVSDSRITVIEHGVPDRPYVEPDSMKGQFGWTGRKVVLTFGLLAPDKGIETVIRAMPEIVRGVPETLYVVLGATHPNILREQGESLRLKLMALARELGVDQHIQFIDSFVEQEELLDYLQASDVYVTPYVNPAQITSGTLSYAVAMGKPVVSTPYIHASEILADDHGRLVPFGDSAAMAWALGSLLADDAALARYAQRAYARGRSMIWAELARRVEQLLARARVRQPARLPAKRNYDILPPTLSAILRMSDSTGMLQHSVLNIPDRNHGYCIDDNARALILMTQIEDLDRDLCDQWMTVYASFVQYGWNPERGRFRNFMGFDRCWRESEGSQDSNARTFWALGVTARDAPLLKHQEWAVSLYDSCIDAMTKLEAPRAKAFLTLGATAMLRVRPDDRRSQLLVEDCGKTLYTMWKANRRPDWDWFEPSLSYDNFRLAEAMMRAGHYTENSDWIECGLATARWTAAIHRAPDGHFRAVGTEAFGQPYTAPLPFDQQPLEAQAAIEAACAAYDVSRSAEWLDLADSAYAWFLGKNDLDLPIARREDGGCYDGLTPHGVNKNQGAESLLAIQLASCAMTKLFNKQKNVAKTSRSGTDIVPA